MSNSHGVAANERLSSLTRTYRHSTSLGMQHARRPIFETTTLQRIDEDGSVYVLRFYRETREGDAPEVLSYRPYVAGETDFSNEVQLTDDTRTLLAA